MNNAKFVSFSSNVDLNLAPAGKPFTATWEISNNGDTTWGAGYKVVHIHANSGSTLMTTKSSYDLAQVANRSTVAPGQQAAITLPMTAPTPQNRRFFTDWQLRDPQGKLFGDVIWLRLVTIAPPIDNGNLRSSDCKFIEDHTIPDNTAIEAGTSFMKQWVVKNSGQRKWNTAYRLVFVSGDTGLTGTFSHPVPEANPTEEVVISVPMVAPSPRSMAYTSSWRIHDDRNTPFGDQLWVKIISTAKQDGFAFTPYSQNDSRWRDRVLGFGPRTFGQFGCLLTCFTMMLTSFGENVTPQDVNNRFLQLSQGFSGSDVFFNAPQTGYNHVTFIGNFKPFAQTGATFATHDPNLLNRIDQGLTNAQGVIIQVDMDPSDPYETGTEQHWVYVISRQGNDYLVLDPANGQAISLMGRYGRPNPNAPQEALKLAIKSVLFYSSPRATRRAVPPPQVDSSAAAMGMSQLVGLGRE